ncbi:MAG: hypothetical protein NTV01_10080 [Bacteroidia bacterium]|nr:hypothetical protein [Bacteroidia bacterium]
MKTRILIGMMLLLATGLLAQQANPEVVARKIDAMQKMNRLEGRWHGKGWIRKGQGEPKWFDQREDVVYKLNGLLLLIEGTGTNPGTDQVVFNAFAMMSYDPAKEQYNFLSHTLDGNSANTTGHWEGEKFIWGFNIPQGGSIRFTMNLETPGQWQESGEYSPDQKTWYKYLEMSLTKDK